MSQIVKDRLDQRKQSRGECLLVFEFEGILFEVFMRILNDLELGPCHRVYLWAFLGIEHTKPLGSLDVTGSFRSLLSPSHSPWGSEGWGGSRVGSAEKVVSSCGI